MSVSISRFVNVMTAGQYGKDWTNKPMHRRDAKVIAILDQIDGEIARLAALGVAAEPRWQTDRDDVRRSLDMTDGRSGSKLLSYLEDVAKRGAKVLADLTAYIDVVGARIVERRDKIDALADDMDPAAFKKSLFLQGKERTQALSIHDGLVGTYDVCRASTDYSDAGHAFVMSELREIAIFLQAFARSGMSGVPVDAIVKVAKELDAAQKDPTGDLSRVVETVGTLNAQDMLEKIETLKERHGVDFRPLDSADLLAVQIYTSPMGMYSKMHAQMLGLAKKDDAITTQIDACVKAIGKLPDYKSYPVFRFEDGTKYDWKKQFVKGKTFAIKIFWSSGRLGGVAASGMTEGGTELHITIFGKGGKEVGKMSAVQGEGGGEILFPPGTKFKTIGMDFEAGKPGVSEAGKEFVDTVNAKVYITVKEV